MAQSNIEGLFVLHIFYLASLHENIFWEHKTELKAEVVGNVMSFLHNTKLTLLPPISMLISKRRFMPGHQKDMRGTDQER